MDPIVDLAIEKSVDDSSPAEGATIEYTIALQNLGPDGASGVEVTDSLPAGVTFVSSSATQGSYDDGAGLWTVGSIAAAAADTLTITATGPEVSIKPARNAAIPTAPEPSITSFSCQ